VAMLERKIIAINEAEHGGTGHVLVLPIQSSSERRISSVTLRSLSWAMTSNCAHRSQKALAGEGLLVGSGCVAQSLTSPPSTTRFCPDLHAGYPPSTAWRTVSTTPRSPHSAISVTRYNVGSKSRRFTPPPRQRRLSPRRYRQVRQGIRPQRTRDHVRGRRQSPQRLCKC